MNKKGFYKKRWFIFGLVVALIFGLAGCGNRESPEQAVKNAFDAIKVADVEKASKYIDYNKVLTESDREKNDPKSNEEPKEMRKLILKNLNYKILSSSESGDTATVSAEITNIDMKNVMADLFSQAFPLAFSGLNEAELDKKFSEIFINLINREENKTITSTVEIKLSKDQGIWKIAEDDKLFDALLGGLLSVGQNESNSFGSGKNTEMRKLSEIRNWVVGDVWNKGFCDIRYYSARGTGSTGGTLDIDFTIEQLGLAMAKKAEYDSYVNGLDDTKYSQVKSIWPKLSSEIDVLYNQIKQRKPVANDESNILDTGKFAQYRDAFEDAIDKLD